MKQQRYTVQCACGHRMRVKPKHLGRVCRCTRCRQPVLASYETVAPALTPFSTNGPRHFSADEVPVHWRNGDRFMDLYEVMGLAGEGGMGVVYKVRHKGWHIDLAVKTPKPALLPKNDWKDDFERECATWVNLDEHPNVVSCHYVRRLGGLPRIFMEYVSGGPLYKWIYNRSLYEGGEKAALTRILDIAIQTAQGLAFAHQRGLVHQDVKPGNVLLASTGLAKVSDFGLVQALEAAGMTEGGQVRHFRGTMPYSAPEQESHAEASYKCDLWSWAATVLEMFAGRLTWADCDGIEGALENCVRAQDREENVPAIPAQLADVLRSCLSEDPGTRPASMAELIVSLKTIYEDTTGQRYDRPDPASAVATSDVFNNRAVSLLDLGRHDEAEELWDRALDAEPAHLEAHFNLQLHRWRMGHIRDDEFFQLMEHVYRERRTDWRTRYMMSNALIERGDASTALRILTSIHAPDSARREVLYAIAVARDQADASRRLMTEIAGHDAPVETVRLGSGGWYGLSGDRNGYLKLWELTTGHCRHAIKAHKGRVYDVCLSKDEHYAISAGGDETIKIWSLATGKLTRMLSGHDGPVRVVKLSDDQSTAVSVGQDRTIRLWDVRNGQCLRICRGHSAGINALSISPDARFALTGGRDHTLRFWDLTTGNCLRVFSGHENRVHSVWLTKEKRFAVSGSRDATIRVWDVSNGSTLRVLRGHQSEAYSVCVSENERFILSGSRGGTLRLWDFATGQCLRSFHGGAPVCLSPDGRVALSADRHGKLKLWMVACGERTTRAPYMICWGNRRAALEPIETADQ